MNTNTAKTQTRGECQCCGRDQAVVGNTMSKHGYTVKGGWFEGVCSGERYEPLQVSRSHADAVCREVRAEVVELRARAARYDAGTLHPARVKTTRRDPKTGEAVTIAWDEASQWQQVDALRSAAWAARQRADIGERFAADLEALADRVHGTALRVVPVAAGPAPIVIGDRRDLGRRGVVSAQAVDRGTVVWQDARGYRGRMASRSWRLLPAAA